MNKIKLLRRYFSDVTLGTLHTPDGTSFCILERPAENNKQSISCILEGTYTLRQRKSPVVERTSKGEFPSGWEVTNVPNRSYIMFHVGNYVRNSDGCLLVGENFSFHNGEFMVTNSVKAFREFMAALSSKDEWTLEILSASYYEHG